MKLDIINDSNEYEKLLEYTEYIYKSYKSFVSAGQIKINIKNMQYLKYVLMKQLTKKFLNEFKTLMNQKSLQL